MVIKKHIVKEEGDEQTGYNYVSTEGTGYWGINDKGEYKSFSRKYHKIVEIIDKSELDNLIDQGYFI